MLIPRSPEGGFCIYGIWRNVMEYFNRAAATAKAAIFDLDGTLVDSLEDIADSMNEMLAGYGFPQFEVDLYRYKVGNGSRKLIERALPEEQAKDASFVDEALSKYKACYEKNLLNKTRPYAGILTMLHRLQEMDVPMAVCTNKHQGAAEQIVDKLFPAKMFREVIGDQPGLPRKPDPTKMLNLAKNMRITPEEVAYFGDSSVDMDTANNAKAIAIGVTWGFRTREELEEHQAKYILEMPADLFTKVEFKP